MEENKGSHLSGEPEKLRFLSSYRLWNALQIVLMMQDADAEDEFV